VESEAIDGPLVVAGDGGEGLEQVVDFDGVHAGYTPDNYSGRDGEGIRGGIVTGVPGGDKQGCRAVEGRRILHRAVV
jgi:hypothetical protein